MKIISQLAGFILLAAGTCAFATLDPDPNSIGVYANQTATRNQIEMVDQDQTVIWICITNPSEEWIHGFAFSYSLKRTDGGPDYFFHLGIAWGQHGIEPSPAETIDWRGLQGYFIASASDPIPAAASVPLVSMQFVAFGDVSLDIFIDSAPAEPSGTGAPVYWSESGYVSLGVSSGDPRLPVARINEPGPVANESTTFGGVKALFR